MQNVRQEIIVNLKKILEEMGIEGVGPEVATPSNPEHGDYTTNIAMAIFASSKFKIQNSKFKTPIELATHVVEKFKVQNLKFKAVDRVEAVRPGFINFWLTPKILTDHLKLINTDIKKVMRVDGSKKIMVEYAHPNTHKEMHIGHMRTLITGEAIARLLESQGNQVFRANYQGDIGPHVAKAIYGVRKLIEEENLNLDQIEKWESAKKAHFLGRGYVRGSQDYEGNKEEIDEINGKLYQTSSTSEESELHPPAGGFSLPPSEEELKKLYQITRRWSLDYYDEFYTKFYAKFDRLFFESEVSRCGKKIVEENMDRVFVKDKDGSVVFPGEKYDLHTRVFVTSLGYPTYEGKEMCLGFKEYEAFPFNKIIHVVGSEQAGYFKVVFKALELLDIEKFKSTQYHLSMGMVNIVGMKISSRTGEILRVDDLVEKVRAKVNELIKEGKITSNDKEKVAEQIAIGAIKYSVLKVGVGQNVEFDIEKSVSLDGNSGPYLQYTYTRTQSVLAKGKSQKVKVKSEIQNSKLEQEEMSLLRTIHRYPEVVGEAAKMLSPNILCSYLFDLAQKFNLFYQRHSILGGSEGREGKERLEDTRQFRLTLTEGVGIILKNGLNLLGIKAPERM